MPTFRRVEDARAGPTALGILVPPGLRTRVILRPRALSWDLLPLQAGENTTVFLAFQEFGRDDAAGLARKVPPALERGDAFQEIVGWSSGFLVLYRFADLPWTLCSRLPGQPYRPLVFSTHEEAQCALARLAPILGPAADVEQEYYFNTQHFSG